MHHSLIVKLLAELTQRHRFTLKCGPSCDYCDALSDVALRITGDWLRRLEDGGEAALEGMELADVRQMQFDLVELEKDREVSRG